MKPPQDLNARTSEDQRKRFLTECQILSSITTGSANQQKEEALGKLRVLRKKARVPAYYTTNSLLNHLAYLLDTGKKEESVAVALTGLTGTKIELVIQLGQTSLSGKCPRRDPDEIKQYAETLFSFIHRPTKFFPEGEFSLSPVVDLREQTLFDFAAYQYEYSFEKLRRRLPYFKKFCAEARQYTFSPETPITRSSDISDEFYIPAVNCDDFGGPEQLYNRYRYRLPFYERGAAPPVEAMNPLTAENFGRWTLAFTWWFKDIDNNFNRSEKKKVDFKLLAHELVMLSILVSSSQLFRDWVSMVTRGMAGGKAKGEAEAKATAREVRNFSLPISLQIANDGAQVPPGPATEKRTIGQSIKSIMRKKILNSRVDSKQEKEEGEPSSPKGALKSCLASTQAEGKSQQKARVPTGDSEESKTDHDDCDDDDDPDDKLSMILNVGDARAVRNIAFKRMSLMAQILFIAKDIFYNDYLRRQLKGKKPEVTVLPSCNDVTTELEFEPLRKTSFWLAQGKYTKSTHAESAINNLISFVKEDLKSKPAKLRQLILTDAGGIIDGSPRKFIPQHPELSLLDYLYKQKTTLDFPYPYIGLPKPPCFVCSAVFLSSNAYSVMMPQETSYCIDCVAELPTDFPPLLQTNIFNTIDQLAVRVAWTYYLERCRGKEDDSQ
ncbi:hypothetical protein TWF718_005983 [Orbilia javanica]|uniref:Uncharacterized protein n=1 Tax=Orbilia javanica TaxID=47235 RepID=A0AAN8N219_9PEZI